MCKTSPPGRGDKECGTRTDNGRGEQALVQFCFVQIRAGSGKSRYRQAQLGRMEKTNVGYVRGYIPRRFRLALNSFPGKGPTWSLPNDLELFRKAAF